MQKDQKLGSIAFSLFVILCTQIALLFTYNVGQIPHILIVSIGTVFALLVGFVIWAFTANIQK